MTRKSGVPGRTVPHLSRARLAEGRKIMREARTPEKQLRELDHRPGKARRERARLALVVSPAEPVKVAEKRVERPTKATRTRRRAKRKAGNQ